MFETDLETKDKLKKKIRKRKNKSPSAFFLQTKKAIILCTR